MIPRILHTAGAQYDTHVSLLMGRPFGLTAKPLQLETCFSISLKVLSFEFRSGLERHSKLTPKVFHMMCGCVRACPSLAWIYSLTTTSLVLYCIQEQLVRARAGCGLPRCNHYENVGSIRVPSRVQLARARAGSGVPGYSHYEHVLAVVYPDIATTRTFVLYVHPAGYN